MYRVVVAAASVVCDVLNSQPYLSWVDVTQVVLDLLLVGYYGAPDASL